MILQEFGEFKFPLIILFWSFLENCSVSAAQHSAYIFVILCIRHTIHLRVVGIVSRSVVSSSSIRTRRVT